MIKRLLRITILLFIVSVVFYFNGGLTKLLRSPTVQAFGDLIVDFHVPVGTPVFSLNDMEPGDVETRPIDVTNAGTSDQLVAVRAEKAGGAETDPKIESILEIKINDGSTTIYGPKTLSELLEESLQPNGVVLNTLGSGEHKTYNFQVKFPEAATNEFQAKSLTATLTFGTIYSSIIVINEVFYNAAAKLQWVELYNSSNNDVSLKNWSLTDNSGKPTIIHADKKIKAHGFALLSKDASVWRNWNQNREAVKVELGTSFGNGLENLGDRLILTNSEGLEFDRMSWGNDTTGFTPPAINPQVAAGHSTERQTPGFDTNAASDWLDRYPPTPGN